MVSRVAENVVVHPSIARIDGRYSVFQVQGHRDTP